MPQITTLEELKGKDLSGYTLQEVYHLTKWEKENPCGRAAVISSSSEVIFVLNPKLLERVKKQLPIKGTDRFEIRSSIALVDSYNYFFDLSCISWGIEDSRYILTEENFNKRLSNLLNPFSWSN